METIQFEWDENKNQINQRKHGISFREAKTVFYDEEALVIDDPEHSETEDRFIILGLSSKANLLVAIFPNGIYAVRDLLIDGVPVSEAAGKEKK